MTTREVYNNLNVKPITDNKVIVKPSFTDKALKNYGSWEGED